MAPASSQQHHENRMGKWGATSYIIGNIIGSGIFITPTSVLNNSSSVGLALIIWTLSALISGLGAYCYLELGTSIRKSGADFAYLCYVEWRAIAFVFMASGCILTFPLTLAIQAETFSEYLIQGSHMKFCDHWHAFIARKLIGFTLVWLLLYLNFFSLRRAVARFQMVASLAKILSAVIIIATGLYYLVVLGKTDNLARPFANSTLASDRLANAFFAGLFSYDGWDVLNFGVEDVRDPRKSMTFAIAVGISTVAVLYLLMNGAYFVVLSVAQIEESAAVATTFAQHSLGDFQYAIPFLVSVLLIGSLNSQLFAASRYLYAASRERQLPAFIATVNVANHSPRAALFLNVLLAIAFSFLGDIEQLINYVAFTMWLQRTFTMSALLYMRIRATPVHPEAIHTPIIIPVIFLCVCLSLVCITIAQNFHTSAVGLTMLLASLVLYLVFLWERALPRLRNFNVWCEAINQKACVASQLCFNGIIRLDGAKDILEDEEGKDDGGNWTGKYKKDINGQREDNEREWRREHGSMRPK